MASYSPSAIVGAIRSLLLGEIGSIRTVAANVFAYGTFEGQAPGATRARSVDPQYGSRFDVRLGSLRTHPATPISAKASMKLSTLPVTIDIVTRFSAASNELARDLQRQAANSRGHEALQALEYPGNLSRDGEGTATGIVSGMLLGPDGTGHPSWEVVSEDWQRLHHMSRISGGLVVIVDQSVL
jgi:hypothetical protein